MKRCLGFRLVVVIVLIAFSSFVQALSEPEKNFEHLWKTFDTRCALFLLKCIDWNFLWSVYRLKVLEPAIELINSGAIKTS